MPWAGLKTRMLVSAGDLELEPGAQQGEYLLQDYPSGNAYFDTGFVGTWRINNIFDAEEGSVSPGVDENEIEVNLYIGLNSNNPATPGDWSAYQPYIPGHYECRYYRIKAEVKVEDAFGNLPKLLEFTPSHSPVGTAPHISSVDDIEDEPVGTEEVGHRYLVDPSPVGIFTNHADKIAEKVDSTNNTWRFYIPVNRQEVYNLANGWKYRYEGDYNSGSWEPRGLTPASPVEDEYVGELTITGPKGLKWNSDGGGDIGAPAGNRPNSIDAVSIVRVGGTGGSNLQDDRVHFYDHAGATPGSLLEGDLFYSDLGMAYYDGATVIPLGGGTAWYQVLDSTATALDIQTALNDSDTFVVFLKPGTYTLGANNISIPAQKSLVGLGGVYQGSGAGADLTITVNATQRVQMASGSRLQNLKLRFSSTSTTGNEMIETSTNDGIVIRGVNVDGSAVAAGAGIVSWAIKGAVKETTHCDFFRCAGIWMDVPPQDEGGRSEIGYIHWTAHSSDITAGMIGVRVESTSSTVSVHDIHGENGYGTLYVSAQDVFARGIWCQSPGSYGVWWSGDHGHLSNVRVDGGAYGCRISADYFTVCDFYAFGTTNRGLWIDGMTNSTFESLHSYNCGGTTNPGMYLNSFVRCNVTNVTSYSGGTYGIQMRLFQQSSVGSVTATDGGSTGTSHHGVYLDNCVRTSFSSVTGYNNNFGSGVRTQNCTDCTFASVSARENDQAGLYVGACSGNTFGTVTTSNNDVHGIQMDSTSQYNTIHGATARGNTSDGVNVAASSFGNTFHAITTQGNGAYGFQGGNAGGTANNTLHGHVSHGDTTANRTLGTGWNQADLW